MDWATVWATFSKTRLVTLDWRYRESEIDLPPKQTRGIAHVVGTF
jgi:hypothetical protein